MQPPWRHAVRSSHTLPLAVPAGTSFSSRSLAFRGCVLRVEGTPGRCTEVVRARGDAACGRARPLERTVRAGAEGLARDEGAQHECHPGDLRDVVSIEPDRDDAGVTVN